MRQMKAVVFFSLLLVQLVAIKAQEKGGTSTPAKPQEADETTDAIEGVPASKSQSYSFLEVIKGYTSLAQSMQMKQMSEGIKLECDTKDKYTMRVTVDPLVDRSRVLMHYTDSMMLFMTYSSQFMLEMEGGKQMRTRGCQRLYKLPEVTQDCQKVLTELMSQLSKDEREGEVVYVVRLPHKEKVGAAEKMVVGSVVTGEGCDKDFQGEAVKPEMRSDHVSESFAYITKVPEQAESEPVKPEKDLPAASGKATPSK